MIIYAETLDRFLSSTVDGIKAYLADTIRDYFGTESSEEEKRSWEGTISRFQQLFGGGVLPGDAGIVLEYNLPITDNRVDVILTGKDDGGKNQAVLVEMKGWVKAEKTDMKRTVRTRLLQRDVFISHPSYQVLWYEAVLKDNMEAVQNGTVEVHPCAYLYNCQSRDVLYDPFYRKLTAAAPAFCLGEDQEFVKHVKQFITRGDGGETIGLIENSRQVMSKTLIDAIAARLNDEEYFRLSPEQNSGCERIKRAIAFAEENNRKFSLVLQGGPGTGKSAIAINVAFDLLKQYQGTAHSGKIRYLTKTIPPRALIQDALAGKSGNSSADDELVTAAIDLAKSPTWGVLGRGLHVALVDEAHRLTVDRSGNQLERIIDKTDIAVFFVDERQIVSVADIGTTQNIEATAKRRNSKYYPLEGLKSSFRTSITRSIEFLMQYPDSVNVPLPPNSVYDFRVFDDPMEMFQQLKAHDNAGKKSRMVAGYTRRWSSRDIANAIDWTLAEDQRFRFQWNMDGDNWATRQGIERIGCIHTCQGMEFDYVGVIISKDITVSPSGELEFHPENHADDDPALKGYCKPLGAMSPQDRRRISEILRNTYFVLLTRAMKGCYVYVEGDRSDPDVRRMIEYVKKFEANRRKPRENES